jgi:hypothetical protein
LLIGYLLADAIVIQGSGTFRGVGATRWRSWLRHYATSQKVVGSSPDEVDFFSSLPSPSSHTMALGSTQLLTEMSTTNLPVG